MQALRRFNAPLTARRRNAHLRQRTFRVRLVTNTLLGLVLLILSPAPTNAAQRIRTFCDCTIFFSVEVWCGRAEQPTCDTGDPCDPGFLVWDIPNQTVDCQGFCPNEIITHGCYDPNDPPTCDLCGGPNEPKCPTGTACTPGCEPGYTPDSDGLCRQCGGNGQLICQDGDPACDPGHTPDGNVCRECGGDGQLICQDGDPTCDEGMIQAGDRCYPDTCGGNGEVVCPNLQCEPGIEPQGPVCFNCGGNFEPECGFAPVCRYGTRPIGPDPNGFRICAYCGGEDPSGQPALLACEGGVCDGVYYHATTANLDGPISNCGYFDGTGIEVFIEHFVNQNGICSPGSPNSMARAAPEPWPASETPAPGRGTLLLFHGRGGSCGPAWEDLLDSGGLYDLGHLIYCVEYAQEHEDPPTVERRLVKLLPVLDDELGNPQPPCTAAGNCQFDDAHPAAEVMAPTFDVPGVAAALKDALLQVPTVGEITLVPLSQGGFVARELVYSHYDELRWHGKKIGRILALGHPFYGKQTDPNLYTPWICPFKDDFDCATGKWMWGWNLNVLTTPGSIDDSDYPQIDWTAVSGDGPAGNTTLDDEDACLMIFGGVSHATVRGDGGVPIESSLGYDEFGFFNDRVLDFDRRYHTSCGHDALCMLDELLADPVACTAPGTPPSPVDTCWGVDPEPSLLPASTDARRAPDALDFDGADQVAVTDPAALTALTMSGALTLEAWIRPDVKTQDAAFLSKEGEYQIAVRPSGGKAVLAWSLANTTPGWVWSFTGFEPLRYQWTHVALTYDGAAVKVYANGALVQSVSASGAIGDVNPAEDELRIGGRQLSTGGFLGLIDDVRVWSRALSSAEVLAGAGGDAGAGNRAGLVGWWRFDEASGDTLLDAGPNGFALSISTLGTAAAPIRRAAARTGLTGGALYFDGVDDHAAVREPVALGALDMSSTLTLEAWIFPHGPGNPLVGGVIVNKEGEYALTRWGDGRIAWSLANTSPGWVSTLSTYVAPARTWTHVALAFDGPAGKTRLYVDGRFHQEWTASGAIGDAHPAENELRIGGRQRGGQPFHGVIDEVRVWSRARTAAEIAADYARSISDPPAATGLAGHWQLDEAPGGVAFDSARGRHAVLGGANPAQTPVRTLAPHLPGYALRYPTACGNAQVDPLEECDDGGTIGADRCSAGCWVESVFELFGDPQGGNVSFVVEGVTIEVITTDTQTLAEVVAALAQAIESNETLAALGVTAVGVDSRLFVGGSYVGVVIDDPGLSDCSAGPAPPSITGALANTCPETTVQLSTGAYDRFQWYFGGRIIPGATSSTYDATLSGTYSVRVQDRFGCSADSSQETVLVGFCAETEISPAGAIFPARIEDSGASPTGRFLYFQKVDGVDGFHLYEGTLGAWYSHGGSPSNLCGLQECVGTETQKCYQDLGTGEVRVALPLTTGDRYYLVSAHGGGVEGPSGRDSSGHPIDPAQSTCLP